MSDGPRKFTKVEELDGTKDGEIIILDTEHLEDKMASEKELVYYVVNNIDKFASDLLDDKVLSFEVDYPINKNLRFLPRGRRIDLFIKGEKGTYIIEFKNPTSGTENRAAIGQLLDYGREFTDSKKELIIVTSKFDINTARTIKYYNLPIRYIYLSKKYSLEYRGDENG